MIPESYIEDDKERATQEGVAHLAESKQSLVEVTNTWRKKYGTLPADLQVRHNGIVEITLLFMH